MKRLLVILSMLLPIIGFAHNMVPGAIQSKPILLKGGDIHTVTNGLQKATDVLIENGKIVAIGSNLPVNNAEVIDITGKQVYPGLIVLATTMGLNEISAVRATRDNDEVGSFNPEVRGHIGFNTDSELIPTVRSNGITHAQVGPSGSGIMGRSSLMQLDGWNWKDALVKADLGVHLSWPRVGLNTAWWEQRSPKQQHKANAKAMKELKRTFKQAKVYHQARSKDDGLAIDVRYEAMRPVIAGTQKLFVHASDPRQIEQAIHFAINNAIDLVIVSGAGSVEVKGLLAKNNIPVIFTDAYGLPNHADAYYDQAFKATAELNEAGVMVSLGIMSSWSTRDLPWNIGQSLSFGLDKHAALKLNTINAAKIMGVEKQLGSIEVGKSASIVVSDGDLFNYLTHKVSLMLIDGRVVDLNNRHKSLYKKYQQKYAN
jgi:imidazolonepropionase-like amidohydrolase